MNMNPVIAVHLCTALAATVIGPMAIVARHGATQRPRLHRAFGCAWVTLIVLTALPALFIRDFRLPNVAGYTPIHLPIPATFAGLGLAFWRLARRDITGHRLAMLITYVSACLVAGAFTLLPGRYLHGVVLALL